MYECISERVGEFRGGGGGDVECAGRGAAWAGLQCSRVVAYMLQRTGVGREETASVRPVLLFKTPKAAHEREREKRGSF